MILNTGRLFIRLLPVLDIDVICDIGSMDGADALRFRRAAADARIYALEPNPENFRRMAQDPRLRAQRIELAALAASDRDGEAEFFMVEADYDTPNPRRGMASLLRRSDEWAPVAVARVATARVDTVLLAHSCAQGHIALWIDAEGMAYQVLAGTTGCAAHVRLIHVEVESEACIAPGQKLYPQIHASLTALGFRELATDQHAARPQFNALFVRQEPQCAVLVRICAWDERRRFLLELLRHRLVVALRRWCPRCLRTLVRLRALARGSAQV